MLPLVAVKNVALFLAGVKGKQLTAFTRQLSILQDAGLPILRSLRILENQAKPGRLKYSLQDTCDEIEAGGNAFRSNGQKPKMLQPALCQYDQSG